MADTAIKSEEEKKEYFDSPEVLDEKVTMLAEMILVSQHFVAFTGAGISTACGIPDYRSGFNTVLETGPGCWETAANKIKYEKEQQSKKQSKTANTKATVRTTIQKAYPSKTHMAMVELMEKGHLKYIVSQNVDGLHRKSGIPRENISEVHGNTNLEKCVSCSKEYMRDFRCREAMTVHDHKTSRQCDDPLCRGQLIDTIINFGENLDQNILDLSFGNCGSADLCLTMGSSLRVTPAADMPAETAKNGGNLVIVNLQKTPLDQYATLCIYGKCDDVIMLLMKKLGYSVPAWQIKKKLQLSVSKNGKSIKMMGVDSSGGPYELFKKIQVAGLSKTPLTFPTATVKQQPYTLEVPNEKIQGDFEIQLTSQGHYKEPVVSIKVDLGELLAQKKQEYLCVLDAQTNKYEIVLLYDANGQVVGPVEFK